MEFKFLILIYDYQFLFILIESQWNLNFNNAGDIVARVSILIESQWNLNSQLRELYLRKKIYINRITVEFKS